MGNLYTRGRLIKAHLFAVSMSAKNWILSWPEAKMVAYLYGPFTSTAKTSRSPLATSWISGTLVTSPDAYFWRNREICWRPPTKGSCSSIRNRSGNTFTAITGSPVTVCSKSRRVKPTFPGLRWEAIWKFSKVIFVFSAESRNFLDSNDDFLAQKTRISPRPLFLTVVFVLVKFFQCIGFLIVVS